MTTRAEIDAWKTRGRAKGATHMIVVCDTFDHDDYPVYVLPGERLADKLARYDGANMQRVMEVVELQPGKLP